jgi:Zinc-finger double-stranded RNA-binding
VPEETKQEQQKKINQLRNLVIKSKTPMSAANAQRMLDAALAKKEPTIVAALASVQQHTTAEHIRTREQNVELHNATRDDIVERVKAAFAEQLKPILDALGLGANVTVAQLRDQESLIRHQRMALQELERQAKAEARANRNRPQPAAPEEPDLVAAEVPVEAAEPAVAPAANPAPVPLPEPDPLPPVPVPEVALAPPDAVEQAGPNPKRRRLAGASVRCEACDRTFTSQSGLTSHERGKAHKDKARMMQHPTLDQWREPESVAMDPLPISYEVWNYGWCYCGKLFDTVDEQRAHKATCHVCECQKSFATRQELDDHENDSDCDAWFCRGCKTTFPSRQAWGAHKPCRAETPCRYCKCVFPTYIAFLAHQTCEEEVEEHERYQRGVAANAVREANRHAAEWRAVVNAENEMAKRVKTEKAQ